MRFFVRSIKKKHRYSAVASKTNDKLDVGYAMVEGILKYLFIALTKSDIVENAPEGATLALSVYGIDLSSFTLSGDNITPTFINKSPHKDPRLSRHKRWRHLTRKLELRGALWG